LRWYHRSDVRARTGQDLLRMHLRIVYLCAGVQNFQKFPACGSQGQGLLHSFSAHIDAVFPSGLELASVESLAFLLPFLASS
jgi:hypothetical protein